MSVVSSKIESLLTDENVAALIRVFDLVPMCLITRTLIQIIRDEYLEKWFNQLREEEEREEMYAFLDSFIQRGRVRIERVELSGVLFPTE